MISGSLVLKCLVSPVESQNPTMAIWQWPRPGHTATHMSTVAAAAAWGSSKCGNDSTPVLYCLKWWELLLLLFTPPSGQSLCPSSPLGLTRKNGDTYESLLYPYLAILFLRWIYLEEKLWRSVSQITIWLSEKPSHRGALWWDRGGVGGRIKREEIYIYTVCCLVAKSCLTLWWPHGLCLPDSSVHGIFRQECWSGLPFPSSGDLPHLGTEPASPALVDRFFTTEPPGIYI